MRSVNKVILIGNLTRDPELRQTPNGQSVATFGLATNREWTTKNGDHNSSAEFHECVAWAHLAEICQKYLKKGNLIYVDGYLKTRSWDTPEGIKKFKTEIVVKDMIRLEKRPAAGLNEAIAEQDKAGINEDETISEEEESADNFAESPESSESTESSKSSEKPTAAATATTTASENPIEKDLGL